MFPDYAAFFAEFFWLELFRSIKFVARCNIIPAFTYRADQTN